MCLTNTFDTTRFELDAGQSFYKFERVTHRRSVRTGAPAGQQRDDRPVSGCEPWAFDLSAQHEDLMAQRKDFSIAFVAAHQQETDASGHEPEQV